MSFTGSSFKEGVSWGAVTGSVAMLSSGVGIGSAATDERDNFDFVAVGDELLVMQFPRDDFGVDFDRQVVRRDVGRKEQFADRDGTIELDRVAVDGDVDHKAW